MNTPTPRTDAAIALTSQHRHDDLFGDPEFGWVTAGFARTLETELAAITTERDQLRAEVEAANKHCDILKESNSRACAENERLREERDEALSDLAAAQGEVERLKSNTGCARNQRSTQFCADLEKVMAELATERARLDSGQILLTVAGERVWHFGVDLRSAIDAARKEAT